MTSFFSKSPKNCMKSMESVGIRNVFKNFRIWIFIILFLFIQSQGVKNLMKSVPSSHSARLQVFFRFFGLKFAILKRFWCKLTYNFLSDFKNKCWPFLYLSKVPIASNWYFLVSLHSIRIGGVVVNNNWLWIGSIKLIEIKIEPLKSTNNRTFDLIDYIFWDIL